MTTEDSRRAPAGGPPPSKTTYVVERLRQEIADGHIRPGDPLRQIEIARRYGVSPTPVREALRVLEAAGTVSLAPNRGVTVREMGALDSDDLYALRAEVEGFACELAVQRLDSTLLPKLQQLAEELESSDPVTDETRMYELNREFHFTIFDSGSHVVSQQVASLWEAFPPTVTVWGSPVISKKMNQDHRRIMQAIKSDDAALARKRMQEHVLNARALRRKYLG